MSLHFTDKPLYMFKIRIEDMGYFDVSDTSEHLELCFGLDTAS